MSLPSMTSRIPFASWPRLALCRSSVLASSPGTIPESEIEALERIAASGLPVANCDYTRIGETVELIDGPLRGVQGIVLREAKSTRLVLGVDLLQRSVTVEIEGPWAVPIAVQSYRHSRPAARPCSIAI